MAPPRSDKPASTDATELEHTVVDGRIEHTEKVFYPPHEATPAPAPSPFIEHTDPAVPAPPPTTSGATRWQPRRDVGTPERTAPAISVARAPTRPAAAAPARAPTAAPAASRSPAPAPSVASTTARSQARAAAVDPPPFASFDDERPQALTFTSMAERDAQAAFARLQHWLRLALAWLKPRVIAGSQVVARFSVSTFERARTAIQTARHRTDGKSTLDLEAESSQVADRTRAKKWDTFRQGKQSSGYLIKDDK